MAKDVGAFDEWLSEIFKWHPKISKERKNRAAAKRNSQNNNIRAHMNEMRSSDKTPETDWRTLMKQ